MIPKHVQRLKNVIKNVHSFTLTASPCLYIEVEKKNNTPAINDEFQMMCLHISEMMVKIKRVMVREFLVLL